MSSISKFDVIIIGAGPAGLNCAYHLKNSGLNFIIIEKNKTIGPKVCAGGITQKDIDYLKLPPGIIGKSFNEITYHAKYSYTTIKFDKPFIYTVDRKDLGSWQCNRLGKKAPLLLNSKVEKINHNYIETTGGNKFYYKHLIGADGSNSLVRRYLKLDTKLMGIGLQYIMPAGTYDKFELHYNSKLFGSWYTWTFPHEKFVSIGTGGDPRKVPAKKMHQNLKK